MKLKCPCGRRTKAYPRTIDRVRIGHIHEQLAAIRRQGIKASGSGAHEFKLHPPIPAQQLKAFEASYEVRLPEAYRAFLLHVGNGGAGQGYGLAPLEKTDMGGILKNPSPLHPDMPREGNWHEVLGLDEDSDALYDGALKLLTQGCSYDVLLMVTGPYRGRVVYVDWNMCQAPHFSHFPDFLTWYDTWLDETLTGYDMTWFGYGLPLNPRESVAVATDLQEPARRRVAAVNNLLRVPGLDTDLLSVLNGALPAEPDMDVAAGVLMVLAPNGVKDLAGISWTLLE